MPIAIQEGYVPLRGYQTWYRVTGDLRAKKTPVVILHGGPGAAHDYTDAFKLLANGGRAVIQYDQLGCGRSTHLRAKGADFWTPRLFLDELENLVKQLGIAAGYHVVGQSWGGMLGAEHGITRPKGLRALVIADSPPSMELWVREANRLRAALPPEVQATLLRHEKDGTTNSAEYTAAVQVFYDRHVCRVKPMPEELARSFAQSAADPTVYHTMNGPSEFHVIGTLKGWNIIDQLPRINVPVLLISGRHDEATPAVVQPFADGIKGVRWEIFENSAHVPHIEETERCMQVIGDFLAEHDKAPRRRAQPSKSSREKKETKMSSSKAKLAGLAIVGAFSAYLCTPAVADLDPAHKGGTMRLLAVGAGGTIDPHVNYTLQYWQLYQSIYDGLVTFKHAAGAEGFTIVPDLAEELPAPADDGKSYTFKVRKGIKFSNGNELTVKDVVASLQRIFKVKSPTAGGFYSVIVGADKCLATPDTCTLEGGVEADEAAGTVTIHLTQPDPEIFQKLAVPHAVIVPADSPMTDVGTQPLPGTGAYTIAAYDPNKQLKIVRNPQFKEWSADAQPDGYPDEIDYDFGLTDEAEINAIENGEADWTLDPPPPDRLVEIGTKFKDQVHVNTLTAWWYAPMNVNIPPFNNLKARQAVNYAVDRDALVNLFGGPVLAAPVCQVLPPGFPGNEPFCTYTKDPGEKWSAPDLDKAKQLVDESGTAGQEVTVIVQDNAVDKSVGTYLQSVLNDLGYKASVKAISSNIQFTYIQNTNNNVQISVSQWYQDYPAASDFLNILFGCDSFHPGSDSSVNISGFCDKEGVDAQMKQALKLAVTDQAAADKMWAQIDKATMEQAPAVPLFTPKHVDFLSKRVGNFKFNAQYYWVVTQSWVK